jgi:hypothetical protein
MRACTKLPALRGAPSAHNARPARAVAAAATPAGPRDNVKAGASPPTKTAFPELETADLDTGLLPRREPGAFPSPSLAAAWERLSVELLEGADTGAPPSAAGEEAAYDPLRDGPARYLGYSNECGCVFFFLRVWVFCDAEFFLGRPRARGEGGADGLRLTAEKNSRDWLPARVFCGPRCAHILFRPAARAKARGRRSSGSGGERARGRRGRRVCLAPARFEEPVWSPPHACSCLGQAMAHPARLAGGAITRGCDRWGAAASPFRRTRVRAQPGADGRSSALSLNHPPHLSPSPPKTPHNKQ